jgi:hypothetical protein
MPSEPMPSEPRSVASGTNRAKSRGLVTVAGREKSSRRCSQIRLHARKQGAPTVGPAPIAGANVPTIPSGSRYRLSSKNKKYETNPFSSSQMRLIDMNSVFCKKWSFFENEPDHPLSPRKGARRLANLKASSGSRARTCLCHRIARCVIIATESVGTERVWDNYEKDRGPHRWFR